MTTEYQQRISILSKNLELFKKSVHSCDIPGMLDNSIIFIDTLRNADNMFGSLPQQLQVAETDAFDKSKKLVTQYFDIRGRINRVCSCTLAENSNR